MKPSRPQSAIFLFLLTVYASATLLASAEPNARVDVVQLDADLEVHSVRPGYWLHVSIGPKDIPANGALIDLGDERLLLVDTPWTDAQAERLLSWAAANGFTTIEAVATHSHADCMGGVRALHSAGVPLGAVDYTVDEARKRGDEILPETLFRAADRVYRDPRGFEVFYAGAGHTRDNVVVWHPKTRILFGGCLVKSERAKSMGYVDEADLSAWPETLAAVRARYGDDLVIVPGHGPPGGPACITHTRTLLEKHASRKP